MMKNSQPCVSIIIPCYNYAHFLSDAVKSALDQESENLGVDIIVVDDGSTDNTKEVTQKFSAQVRYIRQEHQGPSAARNTGLRNAIGDYVVFLDADDVLGPGALASHLANFERQPDLDISLCWCVTLGRTPEPILWPAMSKHLDTHLCHTNISPIHTFMMKKEAVHKAGFFNAGLEACEDYEYWLRCAEKGCLFGSNPDAYVIYKRHNASLTAQVRQQWAYDRSVRAHIPRLLETVPGFPRAGKYCGWLAYASGTLGSAANMSQFSIELARKMLDESVAALIRGAANSPRPQHDEKYIYRMEQYYAGRYFRDVNGPEWTAFPGLAKAAAFLGKQYPEFAGMSPEQLDRKLDALKAHLQSDASGLRKSLGKVKSNFENGSVNLPDWLINSGLFNTAEK